MQEVYDTTAFSIFGRCRCISGLLLKMGCPGVGVLALAIGFAGGPFFAFVPKKHFVFDEINARLLLVASKKTDWKIPIDKIDTLPQR